MTKLLEGVLATNAFKKFHKNCKFCFANPCPSLSKTTKTCIHFKKLHSFQVSMFHQFSKLQSDGKFSNSNRDKTAELRQMKIKVSSTTVYDNLEKKKPLNVCHEKNS